MGMGGRVQRGVNGISTVTQMSFPKICLIIHNTERILVLCRKIDFFILVLDIFNFLTGWVSLFSEFSAFFSTGFNFCFVENLVQFPLLIYLLILGLIYPKVRWEFTDHLLFDKSFALFDVLRAISHM